MHYYGFDVVRVEAKFGIELLPTTGSSSRAFVIKTIRPREVNAQIKRIIPFVDSGGNKMLEPQRVLFIVVECAIIYILLSRWGRPWARSRDKTKVHRTCIYVGDINVGYACCKCCISRPLET